MTVDHLMDGCGPIRRQLLGAGTGGMGYTSPGPEDVPLKVWMERHLPPEEVPAQLMPRRGTLAKVVVNGYIVSHRVGGTARAGAT